MNWEVFLLPSAGVLITVAVLSSAAVAVHRHLRMQAAGRAPLDGTSCIGCGATRVTELAPECFRCDACDFVWGDGLAKHRDELRARQMAMLSPDARRVLAGSELREADALLVAAQAHLENAAAQGGGYSNPGSTDSQAQVRNDQLVKATAEMQSAQHHIRTAAAAMGTQTSSLDDVQAPSAVLLLAEDLLSATVAPLAFKEIDGLQKQATRMRARLADALAELSDPAD